ncbi:MAG TPA: zinc ribbon domain-containing protein, partial [Candidatus Limnocylindria bacterium]|nr:zinc ribbon domain-containing protein [Candidatus Limnocylindria bacterium]
MSRIEPPVGPTTAPFWDATRERRFLLQWCTACEATVFYPRDVCPRCLGSALEWREADGRGTVYAVSVQHKPANPSMADRVPYA